MPDRPSNVALITGCSSGIGRATALKMAEDGWTVYATARRPETLEELEAQGCKSLRLDVTDEASMVSAVEKIEAETGPVGVLVNNAGYGLHGAVEAIPLDAARAQFETNFFGLAALTRLVLPRMRAMHYGRVINISSMGGRFTFPGGGFYHASKHALEAMSDALRFEVRPFGIAVILIEPGIIKTRFGDTTVEQIETPPEAEAAYGSFHRSLGKKVRGAFEGPMSRAAIDADDIADLIARVAAARKPKARYSKPFNAKLLLGVRRVLPDRAWDALLRTQYRSPREERSSGTT